MKKYIIYKHTIKKTNKSYIGFTSLTMEKRLHKHILNAESGLKTKFYNALRKYGHSDIESEILAYVDSQEAAFELEEFYIEKYNTYKNGYNSTQKGGGGWIIGQLSKDKQNLYYDKRSLLTTGEKNPNHSGFTDEEITQAGAKFYIDSNYSFSIKEWYKYCDKYGYPKSFSKCRFNGDSLNGFKKSICDYLGLHELKNIRTDEHKSKLSKSQKTKIWITNGVDCLRIDKNDFKNYDSTWKRGRTINKNKK